MFLRCTNRKKDGKEHRYWNVVENRRLADGRVVQRQVLYLGEINGSQREAWRRTIEVFEDGATAAQTMALFPEDRPVEAEDGQVVRIRLQAVELRRPRQWGGCWLACRLYEQLGLNQFWRERLPPSRKGTRWDLILQALSGYRLMDPGSEWRLHRHWYEHSAMADLLGAGFELVEIHKLYTCLDQVVGHKRALFDHLTRRWKDLFNAKFEVLLYDLTSRYFESDPPLPERDKRKYGYCRDKRFDCVHPIHHQKEQRIEAHIFVAFVAYALHVTLRRRSRDLAPGLTPRAVLEKFRTMQMIDVHLPTTDGRKVILSRYTQPEPELRILLKQLRMSLPEQPPPRVTAKGEVSR
jgi:hypothetical protein